MSTGLILSGLLYPTVGLALFTAWAYAKAHGRAGNRTTAFLLRSAVVVSACWPLAWSLHRVGADLGREALGYACVAAGIAVCLYLLAFRLRSYFQRRSVGCCR